MIDEANRKRGGDVDEPPDAFDLLRELRAENDRLRARIQAPSSAGNFSKSCARSLMESRRYSSPLGYIGEGFDDARLDTLFLTLPVSWRGTIQQYAGRLHRLHADKELVQIFDYADINVSMLGAMLRKRITGYREIGYSVRLGSI